MPSGQSRNPLKNFRRKSSGNALDIQQHDDTAAPAQSSFRVLERPAKDPRDRSSTIITGRPAAFPLQHPHAKSVDNLGYNINRYGQEQKRARKHILRSDRGSGGTTNSLSSGYYDNSGSSARHSSSSTLPSSLDADHDPENGELFPVKKNKTLPVAPASTPEPHPSFAARAGRAFSFGLKSSKNLSPITTPTPSVPSLPSNSSPSAIRPQSDTSVRDRTMTSSSYASTARPPQLDSAIGTTDFGDDDFGNMFAGLKKNDIPPVPSLPQATAKISPSDKSLTASPVDIAHQPYQESAYPTRSTSRPTDMPSPNLLERPFANERRYSWDSRKSSEQLISGENSALNSPNSELFPTAPKAAAVAGIPSFAAIRGYAAVPNRYQSPEPQDPRDSPTSNSGFLSAQSNRESNPSQENLSHLTTSASRERLAWSDERPRTDTKSPHSRFGRQATAGSSNLGRASPSGSDTVVPSQDGSNYEQSSVDDTPRPRKSLIDMAHTASLFDGQTSPISPANRSINPGKQRGTPAGTPTATPKKMTKAQFEQASKLRNSVPSQDADKSDGSDTEDLDDEDEVDKQKKIAAQRRRQEATMSVYRQQMKKVAGGGGQLSDLPSQTRPAPLERASTSNLSTSLSSHALNAPSGSVSPGDPNVEEEDDDVPLGILQAHGFPSKVRPPNHMPGSQPGYASSAMGDASSGIPLPAFARKLPVDPYYGAGLVNPAQRDSLAFGNSAQSVYGMPASPQMPSAPPGGLVGVIASEERSRAGRRGSPNPITGGYGPIPLPGNMQNPQMPQFGRSSSMLSLNTSQMGGFYPQNGNLPGLPPMSPAEQASLNAQQQMAQLMQMQTQMMQQMMALQAGQMQGGQMNMPFTMPQSPSMNSLTGQNGFLQAPNAGQRPISTVSAGRPGSLAQGRSMTMLQPPSNWGDMGQQRTNTMGGGARSQYAGSVYGLNVGGGPGAGYTPSIAPSERSNVGMPSRYRPVSIMDPSNVDGAPRSKTMTSTSFNPQSSLGATQATSPLGQTNGNAGKPKSTIRLIEKLKGAPKSNFLRPSRADDDDDEAGWAQMAKKKEAMRQKRAIKQQNDGAALADLYQGLDN
ncbi:hypothetical protein K461DRAFT_3999 [Myriangium duriaei CBS 260.36]|uniref:Uncharacterized protein n=1 Tax=Myriangium duriaei CBS 260.36 TaxID=1168546 RepID=A0A9P4J9X2_9PEZI|nr:hypothetical protein K461DRAFT_3999 [Myriangium duriaei CBS 260.36]